MASGHKKYRIIFYVLFLMGKTINADNEDDDNGNKHEFRTSTTAESKWEHKWKLEDQQPLPYPGFGSHDFMAQTPKFDLPPVNYRPEDTQSEVKIKDIFVPENCAHGKKFLRIGDVVKVHMNTSLPDGTPVDIRFGTELYLEIKTGYNTIIRGLEEGIFGMCEGQKRSILVPPDLAFGSGRGLDGKIPPNSEIKFDVLMREVRRHRPYPDVFDDMDENSDGQITREEMSLYSKSLAVLHGTLNPANAEQTTAHEMAIEAAFVWDDKDKDGYISYKEFSGPKGPPPSKRDEL